MSDSPPNPQNSEQLNILQITEPTPSQQVLTENPAPNPEIEEQPPNAETEDQPPNAEIEEQPSNAEIEEQPPNAEIEDQPSNAEIEEQPLNAESEEQPSNAEDEPQPQDAEPTPVDVGETPNSAVEDSTPTVLSNSEVEVIPGSTTNYENEYASINVIKENPSVAPETVAVESVSSNPEAENPPTPDAPENLEIEVMSVNPEVVVPTASSPIEIENVLVNPETVAPSTAPESSEPQRPTSLQSNVLGGSNLYDDIEWRLDPTLQYYPPDRILPGGVGQPFAPPKPTASQAGASQNSGQQLQASAPIYQQQPGQQYMPQAYMYPDQSQNAYMQNPMYNQYNGPYGPNPYAVGQPQQPMGMQQMPNVPGPGMANGNMYDPCRPRQMNCQGYGRNAGGMGQQGMYQQQSYYQQNASSMNQNPVENEKFTQTRMQPSFTESALALLDVWTSYEVSPGNCCDMPSEDLEGGEEAEPVWVAMYSILKDIVSTIKNLSGNGNCTESEDEAYNRTGNLESIPATPNVETVPATPNPEAADAPSNPETEVGEASSKQQIVAATPNPGVEDTPQNVEAENAPIISEADAPQNPEAVGSTPKLETDEPPPESGQ